MRETVPSFVLETQTPPSPSVTPRGPFPTSMASPSTWAVAMSMRETESSPKLATHTSEPTKMPVGYLPTPIGSPTGSALRAVDAAHRVVVGVRRPHELLAERDALGALADPDGGRPDEVRLGLEALEEVGVVVGHPQGALAHHDLVGVLARGLRLADELVRRGVDPHQRGGAAVGDEHGVDGHAFGRVVVDGHAVGPVADVDRRHHGGDRHGRRRRRPSRSRSPWPGPRRRRPPPRPRPAAPRRPARPP